jgi:UDP-3-O-[3-hydroxymyristoyl] glucosamine N-acyltransferase
MTEPFFFQRGGGFTLREVAVLVQAEPARAADLDRRVTSVASLGRAGPGDLVFFDNPKYSDQAAATDAGACLTIARLVERLPKSVAVLTLRAPYPAFVAVARALFPEAVRPSSLFEAKGVAASATVHPTARLESGVAIDPAAVVGPRAEIGAGTVVGPGAVIGPGVRVGRDCAIGARVSIVHALIGDRVIIHPGCAIGQDGFGYVRGPNGMQKVPQIGRVIIQDDVEIGANSTIDRGAMGDTVIGEGTKIDNLVQIAHNVTIGRHCILAGQTGISGSVTIEDGVVTGGQAGLADHLHVGAGAAVGAKAGVMTDIPAGERWLGAPAKPFKQFFREVMVLERLAARSPRPGSDAGREEGE